MVVLERILLDLKLGPKTKRRWLSHHEQSETEAARIQLGLFSSWRLFVLAFRPLERFCLAGG